MCHILVQQIISQNEGVFEAGAHLSRIDLTNEQWAQLVGAIKQCLDQNWAGIPSYDKYGWGAAMMLVGTRVFRKLPEGPFTWDHLGARIGVEKLSTEIRHTEYEYIDEGSRRYWKIEILKNPKGHRRFIGTMLVHSGGGWAVLQSLIDRVTTLWNWEGVRVASQGEITEWLHQIQQDYRYLSGSTRRVLQTDDGRVAMAARLAQVAQGRAEISNRGLLADDAAETMEKIGAQDISISNLFGAPSERSDEEILSDVFDFTEGTRSRTLSAPKWQWLQPPARKSRLAISLPDKFRHVAIGDGIEKVRVRLANVEQNKYPVYQRNGEEDFEHYRGPKLLAIGDAVTFPVQLVIEYQSEHKTTVESSWCTMDFPGEPIGIFDHHGGELIDKTQAGDELHLVAPRGSLLETSSPLSQIDCVGVEAWRGVLPVAGLKYKILSPGSDDVIEEFLKPKSQTLQLRVAGNRIDGITFGNAPAYEGWPEILVGSDMTHADYELRRGSSRHQIQRGKCTVRGGRLVLQGLQKHPGQYTLHVEVGHRSSELRFAVLPLGTHFRVSHSASGTKLQIKYLNAELSHRDAVDTVALNSLQFPEDVRKAMTVAVDAHREDPSLRNGCWRITAAPYHAEVVTGRTGDTVDEPRDLGLLRGEGGLRIYGSPKASVRIDTGPYRWSLRLDGCGRRFFPFTHLPEAALSCDRQPFEITVVWDGAQKTFGPFIDQRLVEPQTHASPIRNRRAHEVQVELRWDVGGELDMELLPAWRPWSKSHIAAAHRLDRDPENRIFRSKFSVEPGPYKVRLIRDGLPISGVAAVVLSTATNGKVEPDQPLDPYQWYLWRVHTGSPQPHPDRALEAFRECEPTERNRQRVQLLRQFEAWPPQWFASRLLLPEIASEENLRSKVGLPVQYLSEKEIPKALSLLSALAIRYSDLEHIHHLISRRAPDEQADLFLGLVDLQAGLLVPAFQAWKGAFCDDAMQRIAPELLPWQLANSNSVDELSDEEYNALRILEDTPTKGGNLRFDGLWEARRQEEKLSEDSDIDEAVRAVKHYVERHQLHLPATVCRAVHNKTFPRTSQIEKAVAAICHDLHRWRDGRHPGPMPWDTLDTLHRCVPRLIDYWLNRYALGISVSQEVA